MSAKNSSYLRRKERSRYKVKKFANGKPRLSVFKTNKHTHAQLICSESGSVLAAASTLDKDLEKLKSKSNKAAAEAVGKLIGKRAVAKKVKEIVFDRSGYIFHGRVKSLADGAREAGLKF